MEIKTNLLCVNTSQRQRRGLFGNNMKFSAIILFLVLAVLTQGSDAAWGRHWHAWGRKIKKKTTTTLAPTTAPAPTTPPPPTTTTPPTTTPPPTTKPPEGCVVERKIYKIGERWDYNYDANNNWCSGMVCIGPGDVAAWDKPDCFDITTPPPTHSPTPPVRRDMNPNRLVKRVRLIQRVLRLMASKQRNNA